MEHSIANNQVRGDENVVDFYIHLSSKGELTDTQEAILSEVGSMSIRSQSGNEAFKILARRCDAIAKEDSLKGSFNDYTYTAADVRALHGLYSAYLADMVVGQDIQSADAPAHDGAMT